MAWEMNGLEMLVDLSHVSAAPMRGEGRYYGRYYSGYFAVLAQSWGIWKFSGWGSNWDTVTGLLKVTAIFRNCIVTGLHFQNKECIGT